MLPHEVEAFEVRQDAGYGARWIKSDDGWVFRGFVEPPMEEGHERGKLGYALSGIAVCATVLGA